MASERLDELMKKYFTATSKVALTSNHRSITEARIVTTILIGVTAGIYGFDGPLGIVFYLLADLLIGAIICARFGFKAQPYFQTLYSMFMTSYASNVLTFMVTWVFFHNII